MYGIAKITPQTIIAKNCDVICPDGLRLVKSFDMSKDSVYIFPNPVNSPKSFCIVNSDLFEGRVLVLFDKDLDELKLNNHNLIKNSLWILETDLIIDKM